MGAVQRFALLVSAPLPGDVAMQADCAAIRQALDARGFDPDEIETVDSPASRSVLLDLLGAVGRRVATWTTGDLFVYVSGHGHPTSWEPSEARVATLLAPDDPPTDAVVVPWDDAFAALGAPPNVRVTLLPDH